MPTLRAAVGRGETPRATSTLYRFAVVVFEQVRVWLLTKGDPDHPRYLQA